MKKMNKVCSLLLAMILLLSLSAIPTAARGNSNSGKSVGYPEKETTKTETSGSSKNRDTSDNNAKTGRQQKKKKEFKAELNEQKKKLQQQKSALNQQREELQVKYEALLACGDTAGAESALKSIDTLNDQIRELQSQIKKTINERYMIVKAMYTDAELAKFTSAAELISKMYADAEVLKAGCVTANNNIIKFDTPAYIKNGVTMVPLRAITEGLGGSVSWDEDTQTVTIIKGDTKIQIAANSTVAIVNGTPVEMDLPAVTNCGRTYLALHFLTEALSLDTELDSENKIVDINDATATSPVT